MFSDVRILFVANYLAIQIWHWYFLSPTSGNIVAGTATEMGLNISEIDCLARL